MPKLEVIEVTILNWEKYNLRKDVKNPTWFRMDHSLFDNPEMYSFSSEEVCLWLYILCLASKRSTSKVRIYLDHAERVGRCSRESVLSGLEKLNDINVITYKYVTRTARTRNRSGTSAARPRALHNITEQDITEQDITKQNSTKTKKSDSPNLTLVSTFDFDFLYKKYPLKKGGQEGIARCRLLIATQDQYDQLSKAIDRYTADLVKNRTEPKFIKHFSTFIENRERKPYSHPWKDWIGEDAGTCSLPTPPTPLNGSQGLVNQDPRQEFLDTFLKGDKNELQS